MKILNTYLFSRMRLNKRKTIPLFCSILLASIVISTFACLYTAQHSFYIDFAIDYAGSQHFTMHEPLSEEQLSILKTSTDVSEVRTDGDYTHVTVRNIKKVYPVSEALAQSFGMERNGYGVYNITYNRQLIGLYGIRDPYTNDTTALDQLLMTAASSIVMVMILFAVIISGAYASFGRSRIAELGLLKSIGTTPEQVRYLLYLEVLLYTAPAVILGLGIGYMIQGILVKFVFSLWVTLLCAVCVLFTVFLSASVQIRRLTQIPIVTAISGDVENFIRYKGNEKKKIKSVPPINPKYPSRSLAWQFYRGNRNAYRMSIVAVSLFLAISISFHIFTAFSEANSIVMLDREKYNININSSNELPDHEVLTEIAEIGDAYAACYMNTCTILADSPADMSVTSSSWQYNGQSVLHTILYGFDEITYQRFLAQAGIEGVDSGVILVNNARGTSEQYRNQLKLSEGLPLNDLTSLTLCARTAYDMTNETNVTVPIAAVTDMYPEVDSLFFPYDTVVIMNLDEYERVDGLLRGDEPLMLTSIKLSVPYEEIAACSDRITELLSTTDFGSKYQITTRVDAEQSIKENMSSTNQFFYVLIIFFGILGLLNAVNSINTGLEARKRELEMLRSIGMDKKEERAIFMWEAVVYSVIPLVISIPIIGVVTVIFMLIFKNVSLPMLLGYLPYVSIVISVLPVLIVIFAVYLYHGHKHKKIIASTTG